MIDISNNPFVKIWNQQFAVCVLPFDFLIEIFWNEKAFFVSKLQRNHGNPMQHEAMAWHSRGVKFNTDRKIMSAFPFSTTTLMGFAFRLKPLLKILRISWRYGSNCHVAAKGLFTFFISDSYYNGALLTSHIKQENGVCIWWNFISCLFFKSTARDVTKNIK